MATKGYTKVSNSIIFDHNLSIEALGLYVKIAHYNNIPGFKLNKDFIKRLSGYGDTAFRRVWKELKEKGIIEQTLTNVGGRFGAEYSVKTKIEEYVAPVEKVQEVEQDQEEDTEEVKEIKEETSFTSVQAKELLNSTDVNSIIKYFRYVKAKGSEVIDRFAYTRKLILNKVDIVKSAATKKFSSFNNYEQRIYDYNKLEDAFMGFCELSEAYQY